MHKVAVHDVNDAEAFVIHAMQTSGINPARDETEDVIAAGLLVLVEMGQRYKPRMPGYTADGRFSGYAARWLPGRIRDAYYQMHENIIVRVDADGHKRREFLPTPLRLSPPSDWGDSTNDDPGFNREGENDADDRALSVTDQRDPLLDLWTTTRTTMPAPSIPTSVTATDTNRTPPPEFLTSISGALHGQLASEYQLTARVAWLRALDLDRAAIVRYLAPCTDLDVRMAIERLKRIGTDLNGDRP